MFWERLHGLIILSNDPGLIGHVKRLRGKVMGRVVYIKASKRFCWNGKLSFFPESRRYKHSSDHTQPLKYNITCVTLRDDSTTQLSKTNLTLEMKKVCGKNVITVQQSFYCFVLWIHIFI